MESDFIVLISRNSEEGGDWQSERCGLVQIPCDGQVGFFEVGEFGEEDFLLCFHEVWVRVGGRPSKERGILRELGRVACSRCWCVV